MWPGVLEGEGEEREFARLGLVEVDLDVIGCRGAIANEHSVVRDGADHHDVGADHLVPAQDLFAGDVVDGGDLAGVANQVGKEGDFTVHDLDS